MNYFLICTADGEYHYVNNDIELIESKKRYAPWTEYSAPSFEEEYPIIPLDLIKAVNDKYFLFETADEDNDLDFEPEYIISARDEYGWNMVKGVYETLLDAMDDWTDLIIKKHNS